jgi:hypothetical protein
MHSDHREYQYYESGIHNKHSPAVVLLQIVYSPSIFQLSGIRDTELYFIFACQ